MKKLVLLLFALTLALPATFAVPSVAEAKTPTQIKHERKGRIAKQRSRRKSAARRAKSKARRNAKRAPRRAPKRSSRRRR